MPENDQQKQLRLEYDTKLARIKRNSYADCTQVELIIYYKEYMQLRGMLSVTAYKNNLELQGIAKAIYNALKNTFPGDQETKKASAKKALNGLADDFSDDESMYAHELSYEVVYRNSKSKTNALEACKTGKKALKEAADAIEKRKREQAAYIVKLEKELLDEKLKLNAIEFEAAGNCGAERTLDESIDLIEHIKHRNAEYVRAIKQEIEKAVADRMEIIRAKNKELVDLDCNQKTPGKSDAQYESKRRTMADEITTLESRNTIDGDILSVIDARLESIDTPATYRGILKRAVFDWWNQGKQQ